MVSVRVCVCGREGGGGSIEEHPHQNLPEGNVLQDYPCLYHSGHDLTLILFLVPESRPSSGQVQRTFMEP